MSQVFGADVNRAAPSMFDPRELVEGIEAATPSTTPPNTSRGRQQAGAGVSTGLFRHVELLTATAREHGPTHGDTEAALRGVVAAAAEMLRARGGLALQIEPFGMTLGAVWEPGPPDGTLCYELAATGLRAIEFGPDASSEELRTVLRVLFVEAACGVASGADDPPGVLWEAQLPHVALRLDPFVHDPTGQDVDEFTTEIERVTGRVGEAERWATAADQQAERATELDREARASLGRELDGDAAEWRDRFVDALVDGLDDAANRGDSAILVDALEHYAERLLREWRCAELFGLHRKLEERLRLRFGDGAQELTSVMFNGRSLRLLCHLASDGAGATDDVRRAALEGLDRVLPGLADAHLDDALTAANAMPAGEALERILKYVRRAVVGAETLVVSRLNHLRPELAERVFGLLVASGPPDLAELCVPLTASHIPAVRCEALVHVARSLDAARLPLLDLIDGDDAVLQSAAGEALVRHGLRGAGPELSRRVEEPGFGARPIAAQRVLLDTICGLNASRGEDLLIAIVAKHGLTHDAVLDRTRAVAAALLGERGHSAAALEALGGATKRRWWNGPELRDAAARAAATVAGRLGRTFSADGDDT